MVLLFVMIASIIHGERTALAIDVIPQFEQNINRNATQVADADLYVCSLDETIIHSQSVKFFNMSFNDIQASILKEERVEVLNRAAEILKLREGFRSKPYRDSSGNLTIGYGQLIKNKGMRVTEEQATFMLIAELEKNAKQLDEYLPWWTTLTAERQMALLNLTYNMGIDKLMGFKQMLASLQSGDYERAGDQLLQRKNKGKSKYFSQVGVRAIHVSTALKTSEWDLDRIKARQA